MSKDQFQDIVMPSQRKAKRTSAGIRPRDGGMRREPPQQEYERPTASKYPIWIFAVASIVILIAIVAFFYSGVTLKITPKVQNVFVDGSFVASNDSAAGLPFQIMEIEAELGKTVSATEEEQVEDFASGTIIIFNDFNGAEQRLIKRTRFESPDGKIYRIRDPIVVPGQGTEGGQTVPGSIEARVYAEEPGAEYNIGLSDFKLPGFLPDSPARYEDFFARSKTAMTGGFKGTRLVVPESEQDAIRSELQADLRENLEVQAQEQLPEGFVYYQDGFRYLFEELPNKDGEGETEVSVKGTLYVPIFELTDLAAYLAENTLPEYDGSSITVTNPDNLDVTFAKTDIPLWESDGFTLAINGTADLLWTFTDTELQNAVAGRSKDDLPQILGSYAGIERAEAVIQPFWENTFPESPEDIDIDIKR